MTFFVVRTTWQGAPSDAGEQRAQVLAECSTPAQANGLAEAAAYTHCIAGRDPDLGGWWASDSGRVHRIEVTNRWPD